MKSEKKSEKKTEKLFKALGDIDDRFVSEQAEKIAARRRKNGYGPEKAGRFVLRCAAAAAVLALCFLFGKALTNSKTGNVFELKAYAMERQEDGSVVLREADLLDGETYYWTTYNDGEFFYVSANLKCEGENIKSVDFYTDDGFFAKQYLKTENGVIIAEEGVMASYRMTPGDTGSVLTMYGKDFDVIGNAFTLEKDAMTDDFLLFLGTEVSDWLERPSEMTIRAVATFSDGKTQEKTLTLNLNEAELSGIIEAPPEAVEKMRTESARHEILVHSIPLERCEVVPGSEIILKYGDMYEYGYGAYGVVPPPPGAATVVTGFFLLTEESMNPANDSSLERDGFPGLFDENGAARFGAALYPSYAYEEYDGSDGYVSVIENNGDGTFTGKTYKVPGRLILEILEKMK